MLSELAILQKCSHSNIMSVKEILEDNKNYYIACELLEGGELFDRIIDVKCFSEFNASYIIK
jgi:serine/threonine protein kinase